MPKWVEFEALERLVRPLSREMSGELARALIAVVPDVETQQRYDELAAKNTEGTLAESERGELEALVRANTFLQILKLEARASLGEKSAA